MYKTLPEILKAIKDAYWQGTKTSVAQALGLSPTSTEAETKYRALGAVSTGLSSLTPGDFEKLLGGKVQVSQPMTGLVTRTVSDIAPDIQSLMDYFAAQRDAGRGDYNRHCAMIYTHLEEALLRVKAVIK